MAKPLPPDSPARRRFGFPLFAPRLSFRIDVLVPSAVIAGIGAVAWTVRAYSVTPPPPFPRQPSEFRSTAQLGVLETEALAALRNNPDDLHALTDLAVLGFERGPDHYEDALKTLEKAREMGALDERLLYYAGVMYEAKGLADYAAPEYERFLRRHPEDLETRLRLGNLYYRMDELDKSIEAFRRVLAQKPGDPLVSFNLALALRDRKNWTEALDVLKPLIEAGAPLPSPGGHKLLGDIRRGLGDPAAALEEYKKELLGGGESADLAAAMAAVYEDLKDTDQAIERWEQALRLDPRHRDARARLRQLKRAPRPRRR